VGGVQPRPPDIISAWEASARFVPARDGLRS
jgi:hypothetical protein